MCKELRESRLCERPTAGALFTQFLTHTSTYTAQYVLLRTVPRTYGDVANWQTKAA